MDTGERQLLAPMNNEDSKVSQPSMVESEIDPYCGTK